MYGNFIFNVEVHLLKPNLLHKDYLSEKKNTKIDCYGNNSLSQDFGCVIIKKKKQLPSE